MKNLRQLLRRNRPESNPLRESNSVAGKRSGRLRSSKRRLVSEMLESRKLMAADGMGMVSEPAPATSPAVSSMHNQWIPQDVNNDKAITALDALMVINYLNQVASGEPMDEPSQFTFFADVNGDNSVTALDALQVINEINRRAGEDATDQVELFLAARGLDDQLLPNTAGVTDITPQTVLTAPLTYTIPVDTPFKFEVSVQDLRDSPTGVFQVATNLLLSQADVIEPLVGEVQEIRVDPGLVGTGANARTGTITFTNSGTSQSQSILIADFRAANQSNRQRLIAEQVVALYPQVTSTDQIDVSFTTENDENRLIEIRFSDLALANTDLPRLLLTFNVTAGAPLRAATYTEFNTFNTDGTFNRETLARNFEVGTRQLPVGDSLINLYGQDRSFGNFSNTSTVPGSPANFTNIGAIGPTAFINTFLAAVQQEFDPEVNYDAFSIIVRARQSTAVGTPLRAELSRIPQTTEQLLVYGTGAGREAVLNEDLALDPFTSSLFLNVTGGTQTGITAAPGTLTVSEDVAGTIALTNLVTPTTTAETVAYAITTAPVNGIATVSTAGVVTYTPNPNFFGTDSFVYRASNATDGAASNTVAITVAAVNDAPVANPDTATATAGMAVTINVLANDNPGPGATPGTFEQQTLTVSAVATPANGTATIVNNQIVYTPNASFTGPTETFTYTINDGSGGANATATGTITVTVNPAATGITASNATATIAEDAAETVVVADLNSLITVNQGTGPVVFSIVSQSAGSARIDGNQLLYTPAANANGTATISYRATNSLGAAGSGVGVITVTITPVNDNPTAGNDSFDVPEGTFRDINVLTNDSDVDGADQTAALIITAVSTPTVGTATILTGGKLIRFTAPANSGPGTSAFTYTVSDGQGGTATASVSINITNVVGAPVAGPGTRTIAEDSGATTVDLTALTTREPGEAVTYSLVGTPPMFGTAVISPAGVLTFTPNANASGTATVNYRAASTATPTLFTESTVTFTITPVNDAPVATSLSRTLVENGTLNVAVSDLATDIDSTTLTPIIVTQPANGVASIVGGQLRYVPTAGFNGTNTIVFRVSDGMLNSNDATLTVTVTDVVAPPVANAGTLTLAEDSGPATLDLRTISVVDPGDTATYAIVMAPAAAAGTATVTSAGLLTFTPTANYFGPATLTYRVTGSSGNATGTVTINVTSVNDAPVAVNDVASTLKNTPVTINVVANDNLGPANEPQTGTLQIVTNGSLGTATVVNGQILYTPNADATGTDTVVYRLVDGSESATATITITIRDFLPSTIAGRLFVDSVMNFAAVANSGGTIAPIRDGVFTPGEQTLGGVLVSLRSAAGQNSSGALVSRSAFTNLQGQYEFTNVPPGQYEIVYQLPTGAIAAGEAFDGTVDVTIGAAGGVSPIANFNFLSLGTASNYNNDIVTTNRRNGSGTAVTGGGLAVFDDGGSQIMFQAARGFDGVRFAELSLNAAQDSALLTIIRENGSVATAQVGSRSLASSMIPEGGTAVQLIGGVDDFQFSDTIDALVRAEYPSYRASIDRVLATL